MLRQFFAVVFIALSTQITANSSNSPLGTTENSENFYATNTSKSSSINVTSVQDYILNGTLTETTGTDETETGTFTYQFHDFGVVDIIGENHTGTLSITNLFWDISSSPDGVSIVLSDPPTGLTFNLLVEDITDNGMTVNLDGKSVELSLNETLPTETLNQVKYAIAGSWGTIQYPFDVTTDIESCGAFEEMNGAYLSYEFNKNGTYNRLLGSKMVAMEENGIWEVTKDGQYVIFYAAVEGNPEHVTDIHVAKIKALSPNSMVLNQALSVPKSDFDSMFCTNTKDFEMNKAEATSAIR